MLSFFIFLHTEACRLVVWKQKKGKIEGRSEDRSMDENNLEDLEYERMRIVDQVLEEDIGLDDIDVDKGLTGSLKMVRWKG